MASYKNPRGPKFTGQKFIDSANKRNTKVSKVANTKPPKPRKPRRG